MTRISFNVDVRTVVVLSLLLSFISTEIHAQAAVRSDDSSDDNPTIFLPIWVKPQLILRKIP